MPTQIDYQIGGVFDPNRPAQFNAPVRFNDSVNILDTVSISEEVPADNSRHFLEVSATLPGVTTNPVEGVVFDIESAGHSAQAQTALSVSLSAGYNGTFNTYGAILSNTALSTNTIAIGGANVGSWSRSFGAGAVQNCGGQGSAAGGTLNIGLAGFATGNEGALATNVAVVGFGVNDAGVIAAGHFTLSTVTPTAFVDGALVADNGATTKPIARLRDNSTDVWTVQDGGSVQGKMGTKALTAGAATGFVRIACAQGARTGGFVKYTIEADDGTDFQVRTGLLPFAIVNKTGTETGAVATVSTATETVAVSSGTLTNTFTIASNSADTMDILAEAASSLVETTLRINYSVELYGNAAVAVTPL